MPIICKKCDSTFPAPVFYKGTCPICETPILETLADSHTPKGGGFRYDWKVSPQREGLKWSSYYDVLHPQGYVKATCPISFSYNVRSRSCKVFCSQAVRANRSLQGYFDAVLGCQAVHLDDLSLEPSTFFKRVEGKTTYGVVRVQRVQKRRCSPKGGSQVYYKDALALVDMYTGQRLTADVFPLYSKRACISALYAAGWLSY